MPTGQLRGPNVSRPTLTNSPRSERDPGPETITMDVARLTKAAADLRACDAFHPHFIAAVIAGCVQDEADSVN